MFKNRLKYLFLLAAFVPFGCGSLRVAVAQVAVADDPRPEGGVYLIGMGPGAPDLLTIKARNILKKADRVYCFDFLEHEVARFVGSDALTVASPLLRGKHHMSDLGGLEGEKRKRALKSIAESERFVRHVQKLVAQGKTVAIAAAGDPTIFCPWSWVMDELGGSNFSVVPGLSSFNAANAALEQSITTKGGAVLISSGQHLGTADENGRLAMPLVFFTHRTKIDQLIERLLDRYRPDTPLAIVAEASYAGEQVIHSTLGKITKMLETRQLPKLYLLYVGDALQKRPDD